MVDISHLPVPGKTTNNLPTPSNLPTPKAEDLIPDTLEFTLFTPWGDYNWDTGIDIEKDTAAALMGFSEGLVDLGRGVEQLAVSGAENLGIDVSAQKEMMQRQKALYKEYEKADPEAFSKGELVGFLADPVALAIPMAKAKTLVGFAKSGLITGAAVGGLSHVDEDDGESRLKNMLVGATGGMILTPAIVGLGKTANKIFTGGKKAVGTKIANETLDIYEEVFHRTLATADDTNLGKIQQQVSRTLGLTKDDLTKMAKNTGRKLNLKGSKEAATSWLEQKGIKLDQWEGPAGLFDRIARPMNDRLKEVAPKVYRKLMANEANMLETAHGYYSRIDAHREAIKKLPSGIKEAYEDALLNGNIKTINKIHSKNPTAGLKEAYDDTRLMWTQLAKLQKKSGIEFDELEHYWHRAIKDKKGLMKELNTQQKTAIQNIIDQVKSKKKVSKLSELEENDIINNYLFGRYDSKTKKLSSVKSRKVDIITPKIRKYYADPIEGAHTYVRSVLDEVNRRKLIGTKTATSTQDIEAGFGKLAKEYSSDPERIKEIKDLLMARFYYGTQSPHKYIQMGKDFTYASLLGNPFSAMTQLKDMGIISYKYGVKNAATSLFGHGVLSAKQMGLVDTITEEFVTKAPTRKLANFSFKASGFQKVDQFGKNTYINAAFKNYTSKVKTLKGRKEIVQKWGDVFGDDLPKLMDDLNKGNITTDVKTLIFSELADIHPVTMTAMPEMYAKHPNGRLFYTLQTYFAKQMNMLRRDIIKEFRKGSKKTAIKNAVVYGSLMTTFGFAVDTVKDIAKGREIHPDEIALNNLLQAIGTNKYMMDNMAGDPFGTIASEIVMPPTDPTKNIAAPVWKAVTGQEVTERDMRNFARTIPVVGNLVSEWLLGGAEEYNKRH